MNAASMTTGSFHVQESKALLTRLDRVKPFALNMPMVDAARIDPAGIFGINKLLLNGKSELQKQIQTFVRWLQTSEGKKMAPHDVQRRYSLLKLRFNALLDQLDIFADVLTQRGEEETGVWLAGLDVAAEDALDVTGIPKPLPPLICYLDRGHGAAIRRARTRLPGGKKNPVGIIRVPRERMVGSGIASSLIHEVGHQGAALLDLVNSLRIRLQTQQKKDPDYQTEWGLFERWISEIMADAWSVGQLGIGSTLGLMQVVSLPPYFVFRFNLDDPHPFPWIRVKISAAVGNALYPDAQWKRIAGFWDKFYPMDKQPEKSKMLIARLEKKIPEFVQVLLRHTPKRLKGRRVKDIMPVRTRAPGMLRKRYGLIKGNPGIMKKWSPTMAFAVLGQARGDKALSPKMESRLLSGLLKHWALKRAVMQGKGKPPLVGAESWTR